MLQQLIFSYHREVTLSLRDTFGNTFYTSRCREAIVKPSCTIRINIVCKTTTSYMVRECFGYNRLAFVCPSCVHRVTIGRLRTCIGSKMAFYQIHDENHAKLKISYSCGHLVPKLARYDATLTKNSNMYMNFLNRAFIVQKVHISL